MSIQVPAYELQRGDLEPDLILHLQQHNGQPIDLTNAVRVDFVARMKHRDSPHVDRPVDEIMLPKTYGKVRVRWQDGETDYEGTCLIVCKIVWVGARTQSVPSTGAFEFQIDEGI